MDEPRWTNDRRPARALHSDAQGADARMIMRSTLRLAAAIATLLALGALPVSAASAAVGACTPIDNRLKTQATGVPRASTSIVSAASIDVPKATVNGATVASKITLGDEGIVRMVKIKNIDLSHSNLSDVTLKLRAPDGTVVLLANSLAGVNLNLTSFADAAPSIFVGLPPYYGTFAPQDWLAQLYGQTIAGDWQLEITDQAGSVTGTLNGWTIEITPESCEAQPQASFSAAPNPVQPNAQVTFDASASLGANRTAISLYEWDFDGDGTYDTSSGLPTMTYTYPVKGTYAVGLRVTDVGGFSDQTTQALAVTTRPTAELAVTPIPPDTSIMSLVNVKLDASASSDSDGTIVRYEWDLDGNGVYEVDAGNTPTIQRLFGTSGPRQVGLLVTDDSGAVDAASVNVVVENRPPVAAFSTFTGPAIVGASTTIDAAASYDLDGALVDYEWDFDDDGVYEQHGASPTASHVFPASGLYPVGLRVTDNGGAADVVDTKLTVLATQAPVAAVGATPQVTRPGVPVTFDPTGSTDPDLGGAIVSYGWDFDGDGTIDQTTTTGDPVTHTYSGFGQFTAQLTVTDEDGATSVATVAVTTQNAPPVAALSISPATVLTGTPVTLSAAGSIDPDGTITKYEWDLDGNGSLETNSGANATIVRTFPNRMRVTVKVRVTDNDGGTSISTAALAVDPVTAPPSTGGPVGGPDSGPGAGPGGGSGSGPGAAFTASLSGASIQALKRVVRRGVGVSCQVDRSATCVLELVVSGRDARRLRLAKGARARKPVRIARGRATAEASGSHAVTLKLTPRARRALKRSRKRIVVVVQGTATDASGAKASLKRAVMLR